MACHSVYYYTLFGGGAACVLGAVGVPGWPPDAQADFAAALGAYCRETGDSLSEALAMIEAETNARIEAQED